MSYRWQCRLQYEKVAVSYLTTFNSLITLKTNGRASFKNAAISKPERSSSNGTMTACLLIYSVSLGSNMLTCTRYGYLIIMSSVQSIISHIMSLLKFWNTCSHVFRLSVIFRCLWYPFKYLKRINLCIVKQIIF